MTQTKIRTIDLVLWEVQLQQQITVPELLDIMSAKYGIVLDARNLRQYFSRLEQQGKVASKLENLPPRLHQQGNPQRRFYYATLNQTHN